MPNASFNLKL